MTLRGRGQGGGCPQRLPRTCCGDCDSGATPDSATVGGLRGNSLGPLDPWVGVPSGARLSCGCSLCAAEPGCGRGLPWELEGLPSQGGLVNFGGWGGRGVCFVRNENNSFDFRRRSQLTLESSPVSSLCYFLHTSWDRSLTTCSTWVSPGF